MMTKTRDAILVTGASGFIGRALVAALADLGRPVIAVGRRPFEVPKGATLLVASTAAEDESRVRRALAQVDCVVHLAARAHRGGEARDFAPDVGLGVHWARLSAQEGVRRFILMSSIGVLGTRSRGSAFTEDSVPSPHEPYAQAKLETEQAIRHALADAATDWVILRPPMVYGPGAPGNFARLVRAMQRGWPLPFGSVDNRRHLIGIDNLVSAILRCTEHPQASRQTFLVADDDAVSTPQLAALIAQGLGVPARLFPFPPSWLDFTARTLGRGRIADSLLQDLQVDTGKVHRMLEWQAVNHANVAIVGAAAASRS